MPVRVALHLTHALFPFIGRFRAVCFGPAFVMYDEIIKEGALLLYLTLFPAFDPHLDPSCL